MEIVNLNCPPVVIERVQEADLALSENSELFSWIAGQSPLECQVQSVVAIADRLTADSHALVFEDFCGSVATYARFFSEKDVENIKAAYLRMPYNEGIALQYFAGLRANRIDLRDFLETAIPVDDWSFTNPRQNAPTWHYYLYRAELGDPEAFEAIKRKIAATENGNDATNLLKSLAEIKSENVREILNRYSGDTRHSDGPEGPGMTIAATVRNLMLLQ